MKTNTILLFLLFVFFSSKAQNSGVFTDKRDGQKYKWVKIGNQIWMAENLNYNSGRGSGKYGLIYGRIYDWETAKKVCPSGWHLPSDNEWKQLEETLGMPVSELNKEASFDRETGQVGLKLKSKSGWRLGMGKRNGNGIDLVGFNALPGGHYNLRLKRFQLYGHTIYFWTSDIHSWDGNYPNIIIRGITNDDDGINRISFPDTFGAYIRCIRNN